MVAVQIIFRLQCINIGETLSLMLRVTASVKKFHYVPENNFLKSKTIIAPAVYLHKALFLYIQEKSEEIRNKNVLKSS